MDDQVRKADREYHEVCQKAESSRQEWESAVYKVNLHLMVVTESFKYQTMESVRPDWGEKS